MADVQSIAVVGGGLVGALQTIFMAKEGYEVHLYENRKDLRATGTQRRQNNSVYVTFTFKFMFTSGPIYEENNMPSHMWY